MELYCKLTANGLIPLDEYDRNLKNKLRIGHDYKVEVTVPRNLRFHRKFFALLNLTYNNLPEQFTTPNNRTAYIPSVEALLMALKIDLGLYDIIEVQGRKLIKLHSISFAKMDNAQFERFYDLAIMAILSKYLPGLDKNSLLQEVENNISPLNQITK